MLDLQLTQNQLKLSINIVKIGSIGNLYFTPIIGPVMARKYPTNTKKIVIAVIGLFFLGALLIVGGIESNKREIGRAS